MSKEEKPRLAMTFEDHQTIGSSPPELLRDNPGHRLIDVMSNDEIAAYLSEEIGAMEEAHAALGDWITPEQYQESRRRLLADLYFLASIGRLPLGVDIAELETNSNSEPTDKKSSS